MAGMEEEKQVEEKGLVSMVQDMSIEGRVNGQTDLNHLMKQAQNIDDKTLALKLSRKPKYTTHNMSLAVLLPGYTKKIKFLGQSTAQSGRIATYRKTKPIESSSPEVSAASSKFVPNSSHPRPKLEFKRISPAKFQAKLDREPCFQYDETYKTNR